jgi:ubiquinone/menaquinone biosynthesis C-methylase UbiE
MPTIARKRSHRRARRAGRKAASSDKYELYELAVQDPEHECALIDQVWDEQRGRRCHHIREDFCGTAVVAMEWAKWRRTNTAIGVDVDRTVLEWATRKIPSRLQPWQARRLSLLHGDVRRVRTDPVDSVLAMNFSYFLFKTRTDLRQYFRCAYRALVEDGLFLLDAYGGSDSFLELEEERELDGFTYVWDQHSYSPVSGFAINHIHFRFPDGSEIKRAFSYDWRLWTLPEIQELLLEAGFQAVAVYWEGTDRRTNEGNGKWSVTKHGAADHGWIAYLAARK